MTTTITTTETDEMFWVIETATEAGAELNFTFTGTYAEAKVEAKLHPGASITRWDRFDGTITPW